MDDKSSLLWPFESAVALPPPLFGKVQRHTKAAQQTHESWLLHVNNALKSKVAYSAKEDILLEEAHTVPVKDMRLLWRNIAYAPKTCLILIRCHIAGS